MRSSFDIWVEEKYLCIRQGDALKAILFENIVSITYQWDLGVGLIHHIVVQDKLDNKLLVDAALAMDLFTKLIQYLPDFPEIQNLSSLMDNELVCDNVVLWSK